MKILLSNDDGVRAPGLTGLADSLSTLAEICIVAPDRDRSGASNSLTLDRPLRATRLAENVYSVNGTPTDCVHLAVTGLLGYEPDIVISGINSGANMGDDVIYSGTVAAAMEGRFLGLPAMAISLAGTRLEHYATACAVVQRLLQHLQQHRLPPDTILNVNVPDLPLERLAGFEVTRLGRRHKSEGVVKETDPRGREIFWIGPAGAEQDAGPGTDFYAINHGRVSITPLHIDLTRYQALDDLKHWVKGVPPT
ncbi:MAG: 5'/3'-nucleotidase SurE [Gammaproteobacteria bacterium RBG_16_57_12]|nr:MAG: 5'/3'-nucleotidase SurE [Gammaproteobacteria bacterium RBG_16_57_12]